MASAGKYGLLAIQLIGFFVSAFLLTITFTHQDQVEQQLQIFAITKVDEATEEAVQNASQKIEEGNRAGRLGNPRP